MGRLSDADANNMLDSRFGAVAVSAPGTYYVGLSTTTPTSTGGNVSEPPAGGYERVAVVNNATNFPAASGRQKSNGTVIQFPTATDSWGTIVAAPIFDALTGGTFRGWATVAPQGIAAGATPDFPVGALVISSPT